MENIIIRENVRLSGEVKISGAKNAAVALVPATILAQGKCIIDNIAPLTDIAIQCQILSAMGAEIQWLDRCTVSIDTTNLKNGIPPAGLAEKLRASYYLMGALLGRFGQAEVAMPGGCRIGPRPIDQHLKGFTALGCNCTVDHGDVYLDGANLHGNHVYFDLVSVGATMNVMLAAAGIEGTTTLENAAREPEVIDLANFLNKIGVNVRGAGTGTIRIKGSRQRGHTEHSVIPDRIEAGTFMIATTITGGDVVIKDVIPRHLEPVVAKLRETGVSIHVGDDWLRVSAPQRGLATDVKTYPYPGFPTDLQQPLTAYLCKCKGTSIVTENIFENRFRYVDELKRMGAVVQVEGRTAVVEGVDTLQGARVNSADLRASSALVIAGLGAQGPTEISGIEHLRRGYFGFVDKLKGLGAEIELC